MLPCLKPSKPPPTPTRHPHSFPASQGHYLENTSPGIDLTREFSLATQTNSYGEIRTTLDEQISRNETVPIEEEDHTEPTGPPHLLHQILRPSRELVHEAISQVGTNPLTSPITTFFEHTEEISRLCLSLYQSLRHVRALYGPVHELLDHLFDEEDDDSRSLSESQSAFACNLFVEFDAQENPFPDSNSRCFDDLRRCFDDLMQDFDSHVRKSRSGSKGPALCPVCFPVVPSKKGGVGASRLSAAAQGIYGLHREIDTVDRVIAHLNAVVENDRVLIRLGIERGMDKYHVEEILRQLRRNRMSFVERLVGVEENLFLCFVAINRSRALLLREIQYAVSRLGMKR